MRKYYNLTPSVVFGLIAALFAVGAVQMPSSGKFYQSPGFFPLIVAIMIIVLCVVMFLQEYKILKKGKTAEANKEPEQHSKEWIARTIYIVGWMAVMVIMLWLRISFIFSAGLFLVATMFFYERKRIISNLLYTAVIAWGLYYVFTAFFFIPLP